MPFCARCGVRMAIVTDETLTFCRTCGTIRTDETARFCAGCGTRIGGGGPPGPGGTVPRGIPQVASRASLTILDAAGTASRVIALDGDAATVTTDGVEILVGDGHAGGDGATLSLGPDGVDVEPVGAPRALYVFLTTETVLNDGDVLLLGSQVIRYRRWVDDGTYFADQTQLGSIVPGRDCAVLEQLRADGRVRDMMYLWPGRSILIGREEGDWVFAFDRTMSARHASITCAQDGTISVRDVGSRNGVAVSVRGPRRVASGQRMSLAGKVMRVDLA
ncbi:MAG: FHA domain-containing protein [Gemmatimonadetes bacterium]|nr:FHA domain-containing protein [Gemmatimonadota bacterium]